MTELFHKHILFNNSVYTSQKTHCVYITNTSQLTGRKGKNRNLLQESNETRNILRVKRRDFNVEADGTVGSENFQCLLYSRTKWEFVTGAEVQGTESYVEGKPKQHSLLTLRPQQYRSEARSFDKYSSV
jgi:hypothetical protein